MTGSLDNKLPGDEYKRLICVWTIMNVEVYLI